MSDYKESVVSYFKDKAEEYDLVDNQVYWVLSDTILWEILKKHVLDNLDPKFSFVDAGGGTGRWTIKTLEGYKQSSGLILDLSNDMLEQAKKKIQNKDLTQRVDVRQADLDSLEVEEKGKYDLAFTFHNVLGFVKDPKRVIGKMYDMVKKDGYIVCLTPNYYHNVYFNIFVNNMKLAEESYTTKKGKFTEDMPEMHMFTPSSLKEIYNDLGISIESVFGFPVVIYPGMQETQLKGQTERLQNLLENKENYNKVLNMELGLYDHEDAVGRGNQIIIIGKKK